MSQIQVEKLKVMYDQVVALDDVSLTIESKEFIGIIGPNGGGKTTLIKTILGILTPEEGKVIRDQSEVIGYVPQMTTFDRKFPITVSEVILMGHLPKRIKLGHSYKGHEYEHAMTVMERLGIEALAKRQIGQLSGGQMQRVLIARALMNHPTILILDEPTASVDEKTKVGIYDMLKELNATMTILIVTHDTALLWPYLDRVMYINKTVHVHDQIAIPSVYAPTQKATEETALCPIDWFVEGEKIQKELLHSKEVS
jgi:zinc transport system ATP-binding protein